MNATFSEVWGREVYVYVRGLKAAAAELGLTSAAELGLTIDEAGLPRWRVSCARPDNVVGEENGI